MAALSAVLTLAAAAATSLLGQPAPDFALRSLAGQNVRLSEHRGEVVMVSFWGSGCTTCAAQLAALDRMAGAHRPAGLQVLAVSVDDDQQRALEFARRQPVDFPLLLDPHKTVAREYRIGGLPTVVLIDRGGVVRHVHRDYQPGHEALYQRELRALLNDPGTGPGAVQAGGEPATDPRALDEEIQTLKKEVLDLNRELFMLEEELLFPANTQVAVFLSMDVGELFALDSVQLRIDDKEVANYLYTPREVQALARGGVQRLYLGNLAVGGHELVAFFSGKGPNERDYRRGAAISFDKTLGAKYLELRITDRARRARPEFEIRDWE